MRTSDEKLLQLELTLGRVLQFGVIASASCLAAGLVTLFLTGSTAYSSPILKVGLIILMATPILRVAVSLVVYIRMRDWFFVMTTVMVFVLLAVTVSLALAK